MLRIATIVLLATFWGCGGSDKDDDSTTGSNGGTATAAPTTGTVTTGDCAENCTDAAVPAPTGDVATVALDGECPLDNKWGEFVVSVFDQFSIVDGSIASGVVPITVLEEMSSTAECRLMRRNNPFCDPPCDPDQTCDFDGSCITFPVNQDLGCVTVGGLAKPIAMCPIQPGNNYFNTDPGHPAFGPGDFIEVNTEGGVFDPIQLHGIGVEPLTLIGEDWVVERDLDLHFEWQAPADANARSEIHVRLNIDQHGNTPVQFFCIFPDTGAADIPGTLVTELMDFGVTGFPNATVTRRTVDSTTVQPGDGCVEFLITSPAEPNILVDGYIPCVPGGTQTCPTGMTCNNQLGLCE